MSATENRSDRSRWCCWSTTIADAREMYGEYLQFSGFEVDRGGQRHRGHRRARRQRMPDIILMDLSLPVMDGWEATRRLKADERTADDPRGGADRPRAGRASPKGAREAGCDAFVTKPCLPEELLAKSEAHARDARRRDASTKGRAGAANAEAALRSSARERRASPAAAKKRRGEARSRRRDARRQRPRAARRRPQRRDGRARAERTAQRRAGPRRAASTSTASSRRATRSSSGRIGIGAEPAGRAHGALQGPRRRRVGHADRGARLDARERAGARAGERDGDAQAHGHPDVVRHHVQDARRHRRAAALGVRRVRRRAEQDAEQARVRPQGAVGSRVMRSRRSRPRTRTSAG